MINSAALPGKTSWIPMQADARSKIEWLACAAPEIRDEFLDGLSRNALAALPYLFDYWALPHQVAPEGDWRSWMVLGGRGAGKTRAGAEWVRAQVEGATPDAPGRASRVALVGETFEQIRDVMVFGASGIIACSPPDRVPVWHAGHRELRWQNGAVAKAFSAHEPESLRGPQFDAAWADEFGCAAVDKGTNQPNKFLDPKSSESSLPKYSNGSRDDVIQLHYLAAVQSYWGDPARNPVSPVYGSTMIDTSRMFVWAWDARPYPRFPAQQDVWSDFGNYYRGHWLNGRSTARSLAGVVHEICSEQGVAAPDVTRLSGVVRGFTAKSDATARAALQPLLLAHGIDVAQHDGRLAFRPRDRWQIEQVDLAEVVPQDGGVERLRPAEAEAVVAVGLEFVEHGSDFELAVETAVSPHAAHDAVSSSSLPVMLTRAEAKGVAARWLGEARIGQDGLRLVLPPSRASIAPGDVIELSGEGKAGFYRVDRRVLAGTVELDATRVEKGIYAPVDYVDPPAKQRGYVPVVPVSPIMMDLPLIRGDEVPHAPHIAVASKPWPGKVAVFQSSSGAGYGLDRFVDLGASVGIAQSSLVAADAAQWDKGPDLVVEMVSGQLQSRSLGDVLNGANLIAIGDGSTETWEVLQFVEADLVGERTYALRTRLRGLSGSETATDWPVGSLVVVLDPAVVQLNLLASQRGLDRNYLIGPASRPYSDKSYVHMSAGFSGIGLRPLSPVHVSATKSSDGAISLNWTRRTRIDGDNWAAMDVPLGEDQELYLIRVEQTGAIIREATATQPTFAYSQAMQTADGISGQIDLKVAQISATFGPGPFQGITINV